ncbi:hypothetical protein DZF95_00265 [Clavibacter michiganensis]|nr:hypothetical protein DZF95_00265 [Clavibacter michiganensis]
MNDFEVTERGERFRIHLRQASTASKTYDITWLSAPGNGVRGLTISGPNLTCERLVHEAWAYAATERESLKP